MTDFLRLTFEGLVDSEGEGDGDGDGDGDGEGEGEGEGYRPVPIWEPDFFVTGDWGPDSSPYIGGAYTSYFPPGVLSGAGMWDAYHEMEKLPGVFLAGSDYHAGYGNGYIEGAIRSGQRAADLLDGLLGSGDGGGDVGRK